MNEKIRELIQKADRKCSETRGVYDEILSELIIQECLNCIETAALKASWEDWEDWEYGHNAALNKAKGLIVSHFEVEE